MLMLSLQPCAPVPAVEPDALTTLARSHGIQNGTKRSRAVQSPPTVSKASSDTALIVPKLPLRLPAVSDALPDFETWLHDLSNIKDAFGVEARVSRQSRQKP